MHDNATQFSKIFGLYSGLYTIRQKVVLRDEPQRSWTRLPADSYELASHLVDDSSLELLKASSSTVGEWR